MMSRVRRSLTNSDVDWKRLAGTLPRRIESRGKLELVPGESTNMHYSANNFVPRSANAIHRVKCAHTESKARARLQLDSENNITPVLAILLTPALWGNTWMIARSFSRSFLRLLLLLSRKKTFAYARGAPTRSEFFFSTDMWRAMKKLAWNREAVSHYYDYFAGFLYAYRNKYRLFNFT